jgi:predicted lipoprotein with Yx(FWY)xxD motif
MNPPLTSARLRRFLAVGVLPLAGVVASACSSGSGTAATTTTNTTPPTTSAPASGSTTTAGPPAVVKTMTVSGVGKVLVNSQGQVLYTLTNGGAAVHCNSSCLATWPPVTLPTGVTTPTGTAGVATLGTTTTNGPTQVTVGGQPVYTFAGDSGPGVASGNNLVSFGGTWKVVKAQ